MASARTRAAAAGTPLAREVDETPESERPERQLEILTPKTLGYNLSFQREVVIERITSEGRTREPSIEVFTRPIEIATEFTVGQMLRRDLLDDRDAFVSITVMEVQRLLPSGDTRINQFQYLTAALMRGKPRMLLRELVAGMARYTDVQPDEKGNVRIERPTVEDLEVGMASADLNAIGLYFITEVLKERAEKKASAEG